MRLLSKTTSSKLLKSLVTTVESVSEKHGTTIALVGGLAGVCLTAALAFRAGKKVDDKLTELNEQEDVTTMDKVKAIAPIMLPTVLSAGTTMFTIVYLKTKSDKKIAALSAAYTIAETGYAELQKSIDSHLDETTAKVVKEDALKEVEKVCNDIYTLPGVIDTGTGNQLFLDPKSGRYFLSSPAFIKQGAINVNSFLCEDVFNAGTLNSLYDEWKLDRTDFGDSWGWDSTQHQRVDIHFEPFYSDRYQCSVISLEYRVYPDISRNTWC